jgi:hypothetical protein
MPPRSKTTKKEKVVEEVVVEEESPTVEPEEDVEEEVEEENENVKQKKERRKITIKTHNSDYDSLIEELDKTIDHKSKHKEKGIRTLRRVRKRLIRMKKDVPLVIKSTRKRKNKEGNTNNGFGIKYNISEELSTFLNVEEGTTLSRSDITRAICVYSNIKEDEKREDVLRWKYLNDKQRDLRAKDKKMCIVPDKPLSKLLRYDEYKKKVKGGLVTKNVKVEDEDGNIVKEAVKVTDDSMYYHVIQKLIGVHLSTN